MLRLRRIATFLIAGIFAGGASHGWASDRSASEISSSYKLSLGEHAARTFEDAFDRTGVYILLAGVAATAIAANQDQIMHDSWVNHQRMGADVSGVGNFWGMGIAQAGIATAELAWDREMGIAHVETLLSSTLVVQGLKFSVARARPDSDTKTSFPSGHTQISFATATHLQMVYGWKAGVPAYAMGVLTGLSRLADNAHWFSDVVAGATIGILFGRSPLGHHVRVEPMAFDVNDHGYGLVATISL